MVLTRRRIVAALATTATVLGAAAVAVWAAPAAVGGCDAYEPRIPDPSGFAATIDNPYFPLPVGRVLVYHGIEDGEKQVQRVTITDRTKVIEGVTATVVHDVVRSNGSRMETTFDWYAQDDRGNVWYLGEATKAFEDGRVDTSGSWTWGVDGAKPGIIMEAHPQPPDAYRQECLSGEAEDMAWVVAIGRPYRVAYGHVRNTLRTLEFSRTEPNIVSEKRYAPGLGIVIERNLRGGQERFELVSVSG